MDTLRVENYLEDGHATQVFLHDPGTRTGEDADMTWVYTMRDSAVTVPSSAGQAVEVFRFPLTEGARFGHDPNEPVQGDLFTWVVAGLEVTSTPSGRYRAWRLNYDTPASSLSRWFVPGLGIVAEERHPHKGGYDYRAELVSH
jgi:hypothetical protein